MTGLVGSMSDPQQYISFGGATLFSEEDVTRLGGNMEQKSFGLPSGVHHDFRGIM